MSRALSFYLSCGRSLLVQLPNISSNLPEDPPYFLSSIYSIVYLLSINRLPSCTVPFANIKAETVLTQINNVCPFPYAALLIFSPYAEPNIYRKNFKYFISPSGVLPTDDQGSKKKLNLP